jgi:hypothetical protein
MTELNYKKRNDETDIEYIVRMCEGKDSYKLSWDAIAVIMNEELNISRSESYYRKNFKNGNFLVQRASEYADASPTWEESTDIVTPDYVRAKIDNALVNDDEKDEITDLQELLYAIKKERVKLRDERTQIGAMIRKSARNEDIYELSKDIAHSIATEMSAKKFLDIKCSKNVVYNNGGKSAILELSDWHYGIDVNSYWNVYNPEIARMRVSTLIRETIRRCNENDVSDIWVVNLADLICGRIHLTLRLQSRIDVITQTIEVSEILAEALTALHNEGLTVHYVGCLDNHSRLEPNKNDSIDLESLARITDWYLKERLGDSVLFHDNEYSRDIISFNIGKYRIAGIHGDKDKPTEVVKHITLMTKQQYDLVLTAHLHHFSCDEQNETIVVSNGSLMGTDDYAEKLRLSSKPSQNLIIVSDKSVCDTLYRIVLD